MSAPVRVLLVDDSTTVRAVLRRLLCASPDLVVAGEAGTGAQALELEARIEPDVVVLDFGLPDLDGDEVGRRILARRQVPIVVLSSHGRDHDVVHAFRALRGGVVDIVPKPEVPAGWDSLAEQLPDLLRQVAAGRGVVPAPAPALPQAVHPEAIRLVAVGASTGGPGALCEMLIAMDDVLPRVAVIVVQHIAAGFEVGLAHWLDHEVRAHVDVARDREAIHPGMVRLAPAASHLRVVGRRHLELDSATPPRHGHRPSADVLFESLASASARDVAGVVLSGMGSDGADGLATLRRAGAVTMVQDGATCAVNGMPRVALERGAADRALPPSILGRELARLAGR